MENADLQPLFDNYQRKFFYNQLRVANEVKYPAQGDFLVNDKYPVDYPQKKKTEMLFF